MNAQRAAKPCQRREKETRIVHSTTVQKKTLHEKSLIGVEAFLFGLDKKCRYPLHPLCS